MGDNNISCDKDNVTGVIIIVMKVSIAAQLAIDRRQSVVHIAINQPDFNPYICEEQPRIIKYTLCKRGIILDKTAQF